MDNEDYTPISPEQLEEVLDWAIRAGALVVLMHDVQNLPPEQFAELDADFSSPIEDMFHMMPEVLAYQAIQVAQQAHDEAVEDFNTMEAFQEQLDKLETVEQIKDAPKPDESDG